MGIIILIILFVYYQFSGKLKKRRICLKRNEEEARGNHWASLVTTTKQLDQIQRDKVNNKKQDAY